MDTTKNWAAEGDKYLLARDFSQAIWCYNEHLKNHTCYPTLFSRALAKLENGSIDGALDDFHKIVENNTDDFFKSNADLAHTYLYLGDVYFDLEEFEKAALYHKKSVEFLPDKYYTHFALAMDLEQLKNFNQALDLANKAIELDKNDPMLYRFRGNLLNLHFNKTADADKDFTMAAELNSKGHMIQDFE